MSSRTKLFFSYLTLILCGLFFSQSAIAASDSVILYTPFTKISVPPGESVDYMIDVINNSQELQQVEIYLAGIPRGWNYTLKSGSWNIKQLSILPGEKKTCSLKVDVPVQVNKGNYRFKVVAERLTTLPLVINVSEKGTFKTEFTTNQPNMQGHSGSSFSFNGDLKNLTAEKQMYALMATTSPGWDVTFRANAKQVTSVEIEPNNNTRITIDIKPPASIEAGTYEIPIKAVTSNTSAELKLQVVITGTYKMELTTPKGLLSTSVTAGDTKRIELIISNTGSSILSNIELKASTPANWEVKFEPDKIDQLLAGKETSVFATIKADEKAIPGDYVTNLEAKTTEVIAKASFRISVKTSMIWGWVGILIIAIALGSVYYLFRKFGRR